MQPVEQRLAVAKLHVAHGGQLQPVLLTQVARFAADLEAPVEAALDEGVGVCGKGGQSVPAGVGQPTLLIDGLTVGGTAA